MESNLRRDTIRIWFAHARDWCNDDLHFITPSEYDDALNLRFERDRRLFLLSRRIGRSIIANELMIRPRDVHFRKGECGKPELAYSSDCPLQFNWAHSGTRLVFALAYGRRVGVDIEQERCDLDLLDLARQHFCPREVATIALGHRRRTQLFFKYWTVKEAYLKAEGSGLSIRLNALDAVFIPDKPSLPRLPVEDVPRGIHVQRISAPSGYAAALAADGCGWSSETRLWTSYQKGLCCS